MLIVLTVNVLAELMLVDIVGVPRNNIVEFMIHTALCVTLVYPWQKFADLLH